MKIKSYINFLIYVYINKQYVQMFNLHILQFNTDLYFVKVSLKYFETILISAKFLVYIKKMSGKMKTDQEILQNFLENYNF